MERDIVHNESCLTGLQKLPDNSIDCCVTSPPYWGLRDYGTEDQIGLEKTPELYVEKMVAVFSEVKRVLKPEGTMFLNLGDSYSGSNSTKEVCVNPESLSAKMGQSLGGVTKARGIVEGLKPKDLVGIPWMVAFALRSSGWYLRQDIIWHKPNPMPESVRDRCTKSHEYIFLMSKSQKYYYDYEAIMEPYTEQIDRWGGEYKQIRSAISEKFDEAEMANANSLARSRDMRPNKNGRNKRSVWTVPTKPFKGAHFATFPEDLIIPCILAGCPKGGIVLDPFIGANTVGLVCKRLDRYYVGYELNPDYIQIGNDRINALLHSNSLFEQANGT